MLTLTGSCYKSRPFSLLFTVHSEQEKKRRRKSEYCFVSLTHKSLAISSLLFCFQAKIFKILLLLFLRNKPQFLHVETENWSWRCQHMEDSDWRSELSAEFRRDVVNDIVHI
eukprot:XP_024455051.1 uncharacterized protein LOC112327221 [Populus trichocarpa]